MEKEKNNYYILRNRTCLRISLNYEYLNRHLLAYHIIYHMDVELFYVFNKVNITLRTELFVGSEGMAPLPVTVAAPQAFAKSSASLNLFSS